MPFPSGPGLWRAHRAVRAVHNRCGLDLQCQCRRAPDPDDSGLRRRPPGDMTGPDVRQGQRAMPAIESMSSALFASSGPWSSNRSGAPAPGYPATCSLFGPPPGLSWLGGRCGTAVSRLHSVRVIWAGLHRGSPGPSDITCAAAGAGSHLGRRARKIAAEFSDVGRAGPWRGRIAALVAALADPDLQPSHSDSPGGRRPLRVIARGLGGRSRRGPRSSVRRPSCPGTAGRAVPRLSAG